jgi:ketosteroid isomerase-like protein
MQMGNTIIDTFFTELGSGNEEAALEMVTPDATFEAQGPSSVPIGQVFRSEWALYCEVRDGRVRTYKMFEDTAGLAAACGRSSAPAGRDAA